jgi:hypothetical protein
MKQLAAEERQVGCQIRHTHAEGRDDREWDELEPQAPRRNKVGSHAALQVGTHASL